MLRYVAWSWDADDPLQQREAHALHRRMLAAARWRAVLDLPGLTVACGGLLVNADVCYQLADRNGIVLGTLFSRVGEPVQWRGELPDAAAIVDTGGRLLIDRYHGEYVAFAHDRGVQKTIVLQCPSAGRPAYRTRIAGMYIYFTELADLKGLLDFRIEIDWDYVAANAVAPIVHTRATALRSIIAMEGGDCDEISKSGLTTRSRWSLVEFACRRRQEDIAQCLQETRDTVVRSVNSWASCHDSVVVALSGGLDSSIVLSCLADAPTRPKVSAGTHYGHDVGSDERPFARIAAQSAGCEHVELPLKQQVDLRSWTGIAPTPRPGSYISLFQQKELIGLAHRVGATAIFTGDAGDAGFQQAANVRMVTDFVHYHGLGVPTIRVILATAELTETSVWKVTREALRGLKWRQRSNAKALTEALQFRKLASASAKALVLEQPDRYTPSHLREAMALPPARFMHVYMLSQPMLCRTAFANWDDPIWVSPFDSEIVKAFCLSVPAYVHCREGRTRWLPRNAFAGRVDPILLDRTSKGRPEAFLHSIADDNLGALRDRLIDGVLVKQGVLDRKSVEGALRGHAVDASATELLMAYSTEVWLELMRHTAESAMAA